MTLTNKRKHDIRWEVVDAAITRLELLQEGTTWLLESETDITEEETNYYRQICKRIARTLDVDNHAMVPLS